MFTGSWQVDSNFFDVAFRDDQSIDRLFSLPGEIPNFQGFFGFTGSISNYFHQGTGCSQFADCFETWSGVFSGGTVSFAAISPVDLAEYTFTGVITGGSFRGELGCAPGDCQGFNEATFSFVSTSTRYFSLASGEVLNPWTSPASRTVPVPVVAALVP